MTKTIFVTPGLIEFEAVFTFGINAKLNDNPIGYFGTGLKYAIATLLRTGHKISIRRGADLHKITAREIDFRGKIFHKVYLDERDLGFTTDLGKNWEVWEAYRELHSNTLDEVGFVETDEDEVARVTSATEDHTQIIVEGDGIRAAWRDRGEIFCSDRHPIAATDEVQVLPQASPYIYYRGVRVGKLPKSSRYTYNILAEQTLSEDRHLLCGNLEWALGKMVAKLEDEKLLRAILTQKGDAYEADLDFNPSTPSEAFFEAFAQVQRVASVNSTARDIARARQKYEMEPVEMDEIQRQQLARAIKFLAEIGYNIERFPIRLMELNGGLGMAKDGVIYISPAAFRMGTKYVAGTLYEEYIHLADGCQDCTRAMQNILVDTIMSMGEKLVGFPL